MKRRILSLLLVLGILSALFPLIQIPTYAASESFSDVPGSSYYHDPVLWAVNNSITNGTGSGKFSPEKDCTRGQIVTFLWRAKGCPDPQSKVNPFSDVATNAYYYKAVLWAVEEGITAGTGKGKFSPEATCTRGQVATFLWRTQGEPGVTSGNPFSDVGSNTYYYKAILWAVDEGITNGTGKGKFSPDASCTRGQIVTFLYRALAQKHTEELKVALITDFGEITDMSFNQAAYEAGRAWCDDAGVEFLYYKPVNDSNDARIDAMEMAIADGNNVLILPGFSFASAIVETAEQHPDVYYVALDVGEFDLQDAAGHAEDFGYVYPANVFAAVYQEEIAGFLAGAAAVKMGYTNLGFLGGIAVPAVMRFGYGFLQGADYAAGETGKTAYARYCYGNQFFGDADITAYMDTWYASGTQAVFACGGGIFTSAAEAATKFDGKIIGVDVDQKPIIDGMYGEGLTITSAMKGFGATVKMILSEIQDGNWAQYAGKVETLGLVSGTDLEANFVGLPGSTQFNEDFTKDDYAKLVAAIHDGTISVSANTDTEPSVTNIIVDYQGNIK